MSVAASQIRVFRLPGLTYVPVVFLWVGSIPFAFAASGDQGAPARIGLSTLVLIVPLLATIFVARSATIVGPPGIRVRAPFGQRILRWDDLRGLSVTGRSVYAVLRDGSIRLPCVRVTNLADIARASAGRLPEIADPPPRFAPSRRRRRRR